MTTKPTATILEHMNRTNNRSFLMLKFVVEYIEQHNYPPTQREIGDAEGINASVSIVNNHLAALEKEGYLNKTPDISRGIVLTNKGKARGLVPVDGRQVDEVKDES